MYMGYAPPGTAQYGQSLLNLLAQAHRALEMTTAISHQLLLNPSTARMAGLQELHTVLPVMGYHLDTAMGAARLAASGYNTPLIHSMIARGLAAMSEQQDALRSALTRLGQAGGPEDVTAATSAWAALLPTAVQQATDLLRSALGPDAWQRMLTGEATPAATARPAQPMVREGYMSRAGTSMERAAMPPEVERMAPAPEPERRAAGLGFPTLGSTESAETERGTVVDVDMAAEMAMPRERRPGDSIRDLLPPTSSE